LFVERRALLSKPPQRAAFSVICSSGADSREGENNPSKAKHIDDNNERLLEKALEEAIESENYSEAARLRDRLRAMHETETARVMAMNKTFYQAFESGDMKLMRSIWAVGENVHCIHPGSGRISGYDMVISSWELMIGPESGAPPLKIELHNLEVQVKDGLAYVTCLEVVRTQGSSWGKQLATNIFEKRDGKWYICMHHASHITL
jgi:ketosteroid isomerase-like protein